LRLKKKKKKLLIVNNLEALVLRQGFNTVQWLCRTIHKDFETSFKHALVWGKSAKHSPQRVGLAHELADEDVVELVKV